MWSKRFRGGESYGEKLEEDPEGRRESVSTLKGVLKFKLNISERDLWEWNLFWGPQREIEWERA